MDDREIERLIAELRAMLRETGFGWAGEQAEAALPPATPNRALARALIDAAEAMTVDLAHAELFALELLGVEEMVFKPDPGADDYGDGESRDLNRTRSAVGSDDGNWLRGQQRRAALEEMAIYAKAFRELKRRVDGLV